MYNQATKNMIPLPISQFDASVSPGSQPLCSSTLAKIDFSRLTHHTRASHPIVPLHGGLPHEEYRLLLVSILLPFQEELLRVSCDNEVGSAP